MNNKFFHASILLLSGFMLAPNSAHANIFKCVNNKGAVYYNDKPCPKKDKETELKAVKDPKSRYIPTPYPKIKENTQKSKGIVVGDDLAKDKDQKTDSKNRKKQDLTSNSDTAKKTLNANPQSSKQSFADPTTPLTSNTTEDNFPTIKEEWKASGKTPPKNKKGESIYDTPPDVY